MGYGGWLKIYLSIQLPWNLHGLCIGVIRTYNDLNLEKKYPGLEMLLLIAVKHSSHAQNPENDQVKVATETEPLSRCIPFKV